MVDYAYVPTIADPFMTDAKAYLKLARPKLTFVDKGQTDLQSILKWVDDKAQAQRPAEIIVVSHAWPHAMSIHLVPKQDGDSSYARLVDLQPPDPGFTLPARYKVAPVDPEPRTRLTVMGCRVGSSEPYMLLLKTLLGGELEVRAAQHYQYAFHIRDRYFAFLAYSFELHRKDPIPGHQTLSKEFTDEHFKRYDTNDVPAADLQALLDQLLGPPDGPKKLKPEEYLPDENSTGKLKILVHADLNFPAGSALDFEKVLGSPLSYRYKKFRYEAERVEQDVAIVDGTSALPSDAEVKTRVEKVKTDWEARYGEVAVTGGGKVKQTYGQSLGLHEGEDLFTRIKFKPIKTANGFKIVGTYYRYELEMPVSSISDGILFFTGRRQVGANVKEHPNWPTGTEFEALFRTV